jgi:hypothetical protein
LEKIPYNLRSDELCDIAIEQNIKAIKYTPITYYRYNEISLLKIKDNIFDIKFISDTIFNYEIIIDLIKHFEKINYKNEADKFTTFNEIFKRTNPGIANYKELCYLFITNVPELIQFIDKNIIDYDLAKIALLSNPYLLSKIPKKLLNFELFKICISENGELLEYVPNNIEGYIELCKLAISQTGNAILYIDPNIEDYQEIIKLRNNRKYYNEYKYINPNENNNNLLTEDISGSMNAAIVYHRTAGIHNIFGIIKDGYKATGENMSVYGKGFYGCYKKESIDNIPYGSMLGNFKLKCLVNNLRGNFLIFDIKEAKKIYGNNYNLYEQIPNLPDKAVEYLSEINELFLNDNIDYNNILGFVRKFDNLLGKEVKGIIYKNGVDDNDVLVCYNTKIEDGFLYILGFSIGNSDKLYRIRYNQNTIQFDYSFWRDSVFSKASSIKFVPVTTEGYYELCKIAVSKDGSTLEYIPKNKLTKELCLLAVSQESDSIRFVPSDIEDYFEICKLAASDDGSNLFYIKGDDEFKTQLIPYKNNSKYYNENKIVYKPNEDTNN